MLKEMLQIQKQIEGRESLVELNIEYLKRPEQGREFFNVSIQDAKKDIKKLWKEIAKLRREYNELLKELIIQEADFDMIFDIYEDEIEDYVDSVCKVRYTLADMYL